MTTAVLTQTSNVYSFMKCEIIREWEAMQGGAYTSGRVRDDIIITGRPAFSLCYMCIDLALVGYQRILVQD